MAIDMPPVLPPSLVDIATMQAINKRSAMPFLEGYVGKIQLEVMDFPYFKENDIRRLMDASKTPSQFIRSLNKAYYRSGKLLIQILYAQQGGKVFVIAVQSKLAEIRAPHSIMAHFEGLEGEPDLTAAEFDRHRILANIKSQRQGINYSVSYQVTEDFSSVVMSLNPSPADVDKNEVYLSVGNQGNRYVGRYFAGTGWRHWFSSGGELKLDYVTAMVDWGEAMGGKSYDGGLLNFNYPASYGLYTLDGLYSSYSREATYVEITSASPLNQDLSQTCLFPQASLCTPPITDALTAVSSEQVLLDIDAETSSIRLSGEQLAFSNLRKRISMIQRLEWIDDEITDKSQGVLLDESYGSVSLGAKYLGGGSALGYQTQADLLIKYGASSDSGTLGTDESPDLVSIGKRTAEFLIVQPKLSAYIDLHRNVRMKLDLSGQFSDGNQLPQMQQYVLGGISQLSAFLPGVLVGDSGAYARLSLSGIERDNGGITFVPSVYVEHGQSWFEDVTGPAGDTRSISDAGIGFLVKFGSIFKLELVAAESIDEEELTEEYLQDFEVDFFARIWLGF